MSSSRRIAVLPALAAAAWLVPACTEGDLAGGSDFRVITADDLAPLGPGERLELDLGEGPVRFELAAGPIDFSRVAVRGDAGRPALVQDLLDRHGARWGVRTAELAPEGGGFTLAEDMLRAPASASLLPEDGGRVLWSQTQAIARLPRVDQLDADRDGVPRFLVGDLGVLPSGEARDGARAYLDALAPAYRMTEAADLEPVRSRTDDLGVVHVRFQQYLHDLPVVGAELTVHAEAATGQVHAVTGRFVPADALPSEPTLDADPAIAAVADDLAADWTSDDAPELVYIATDDGAHLAWQATVEYSDAEGPQRDRVFVDARTGELVARHALIHRALSRKVYTANNQEVLPGTLLFSEGGTSADTTAKAAYDNAGVTYNFYKAKFNRDSFNGGGATIHSTVHFGYKMINAFWDGQQMAYGDGDGATAGAFSKDLDVVAHELTHAVTQYEANLAYQNESGALNEGFSDIMAAAADVYKNGLTTNTWRLAEGIWTPNNASDAMRYMNNPTADGQSYDYYPERYQGNLDYGGVHLNSGIANLAFYLLVQGGKHPRGKTTTQVTGIGIDKATQIFYRALANYLSSGSNFQAARNATAQAATDLYTATEVTAVHAAWTAVGVPGAPGGGGGTGGGTCSGTAFQGSLGGSGAQQYQPNGNYYNSNVSGVHSGCLVGPAGADFDLYLQKWNGSAWTIVAKSEGETSSESINYNGTAGSYVWVVKSYSGGGGYTLTLKAP